MNVTKCVDGCDGMCNDVGMTNRRPLTTGNLPPKGRKLIVHGAYLGGSFTPTGTGGVLATYHGLTNGHCTFQGRTADSAYVAKSSDIRWELA